jgi:cytochrome c-type protein NapC
MMTEPGTKQGGIVARTWRRLRQPSTRWSLLTLLVVGALIGFAGTVGTQVMVEVTGTNAFCSSACHTMEWVAKEHAESVHGTNSIGVHATCHDCHIPKDYPELLWYKAKAGTRDVIGEMRGVIDTQQLFEKERARLAQDVWDEFKANGSRNCRNCHEFSTATLAKQEGVARQMHQRVLEGKATCIDCHKGVAHKIPG